MLDMHILWTCHRIIPESEAEEKNGSDYIYSSSAFWKHQLPKKTDAKENACFLIKFWFSFADLWWTEETRGAGWRLERVFLWWFESTGEHFAVFYTNINALASKCVTLTWPRVHVQSGHWSQVGRNTETVGELWLGLLRFYTEEFDFREHVVCIRQHARLTTFNKQWTSKYIVIEGELASRCSRCVSAD